VAANGRSGIPTIRDRVVQTAAKLLLEPIFEADFDPHAYGYRPKRIAQDVIQEVQYHATLPSSDMAAESTPALS